MDKILLVAHHDQDLLGRLDKEFAGWNVKSVDDGNGVLNLVDRFKDSVAAVVIDLDLPKRDGLAVLRKMRRTDPAVPIVALTKNGTSPDSGEADKAGATVCTPKPVDHDGLVRTIQRMTDARAAKAGRPVGSEGDASGFLWLDPAMKAVQSSLHSLAAWDVPVVFLGETGVGKEVAARALHRLSPRAAKPLVKINCAALPSELLESELFGYEKGSFTGAVGSKPGKFELANGGTILLDEIGDMDLNLQAKLLHVLQNGEFDRIGGRKSVQVDVRVLAATHQNLESAISQGSFREDLFYRLNVASVSLPPLRERTDEILPLAQLFLVKHGAPQGVELPELSTHLSQALLDYDWPGNVRELENVVRRFLVFRQPEAIVAELRKRRLARRPPAAEHFHAPGATPAANGSAANGIAAGTHSDVGPMKLNGAVGGNGKTNGIPAENGITKALNGHAGAFTNGSSAGNGNGIPMSRPWSSSEAWQNGSANGTAGMPTHDRAEGSACPNGEDVNGGASRTSEGQTDHFNLDNGQRFSTLPQVAAYSRELERRTITAALNRCTWNRKKAAKALKIDYKGLLYKMKKLEIGETDDSPAPAGHEASPEQRGGSAALVVVPKRDAATTDASSDGGPSHCSKDVSLTSPVRRGAVN